MAITFSPAPKKNFPNRLVLKDCLKATAKTFAKTITDLSYVFVSDEELLEMNRQYLQHDYFTDIITFDNCEDEDTIEGDVFISTDQVEENGQTIGKGILEEYLRVLAHGLLHLCGLGDKSDTEIETMRTAEEAFIALYQSKILA
jgi:rRNA maturation RNase YbeY